MSENNYYECDQNQDEANSSVQNQPDPGGVEAPDTHGAGLGGNSQTREIYKGGGSSDSTHGPGKGGND